MRRLLSYFTVQHASFGLRAIVKTFAQEVVGCHAGSATSLQVGVSQYNLSVQWNLVLRSVQKVVDIVSLATAI